jgi:inner membrane protein
LDPFTHTFAGAALAASGLRRTTPLATAALVIGANAPDIDVLVMFGAPFQDLALRRGWTHGVLALVTLPWVVAGVLLLWDRTVRRKRDRIAEPVRAGPILALSAVAVATHPALDWINNYGVRWLMPFDRQWFYGDAVFIIDPWLWLALGGITFLAYSRKRRSLLAGAAFGLLATALVVVTPGVPNAARALWLVGIAAIAAIRIVRAPLPGPRLERAARVVLGCVAAYIGAHVLADFAERELVRRQFVARGIDGIESVMVAPAPVNPFVGEVVAATASVYYLGRWSWLPRPALTLAPASLSKRTDGPLYAAAATTIEAQRFLSWARFPLVEIDEDADGYVVRFFDARYRATGRLSGPSVPLDHELRPR